MISHALKLSTALARMVTLRFFLLITLPPAKKESKDTDGGSSAAGTMQLVQPQ